MKDFIRDNSAWADFLISKTALIIASIVLFAALFHLVSTFKELEVQEQLNSLALDFKKSVDQAGAENLQQASRTESQGGSEEIHYYFEEKENFRALPSGGDIKLRVSGEYLCLEAKYDERKFISVKPFAFIVLPFNESIVQEKLRIKFGTEGSKENPLKTNYSEIKTFLQVLGTNEAILDPSENISIKNNLIYVKEGEEVSAFGCILIYQ
ncbi:MAG TPA: hypothetical protein VN278_00860 [Methanosarcina sp.]|nr:hypothetical protein [Methanosarcina sp.]